MFAKSCSEKMAKDVLTCILMHKFSLEDESVKEAWSVLCVELVEDGTPSALNGHPDIPSTDQLLESEESRMEAGRGKNTGKNKLAGVDLGFGGTP